MYRPPSIATVLALAVFGIALIFGCGGGTLNLHLPQQIVEKIAGIGR